MIYDKMTDQQKKLFSKGRNQQNFALVKKGNEVEKEKCCW
jgi:hypothetical protein